MDFAQVEKHLREHVQALAATPRTPGSSAHRFAANYLRTHLGQAGFAVEDDAFHEAGFTGLNLLTRPQPATSDLPLVIVGAHYDSVAGSPGADDNASAVAAL